MFPSLTEARDQRAEDAGRAPVTTEATPLRYAPPARSSSRTLVRHETQPGARGHHAEIGVTQLALDDVERDAFGADRFPAIAVFSTADVTKPLSHDARP